MSYYKQLRKTSSGFTLIELLVVIAIIGILSSIVLASLNGARERSRDARRQTDLNQIRLALEQLYSECGQYPDVGGLDAANAVEVGSSTVAVTAADCEGTQNTLGAFMSQVPDDPSQGSYAYTGTVSDYCIAASLEGGNAPDNSASCGAEGALGTTPYAANGGATYSIQP